MVPARRFRDLQVSEGDLARSRPSSRRCTTRPRSYGAAGPERGGAVEADAEALWSDEDLAPGG